MSCQCTPNQDCKCALTFKTEDGYLIPSIGGVPQEPIDLTDLVASAETDTELKLDLTEKSLVYIGEKGSPDSIFLKDIAEQMPIAWLANVNDEAAVAGDIFTFNGIEWVPYTVPEGELVNLLGTDADGNIVRAVAADPLPGSTEVPLGGGIFWTGDEADLPSNFVRADGRELNRSTYADYFALVGTRYGPGNTTTTFNIPMWNGKTLVGMDEGDPDFEDQSVSGGQKSINLAHSHTVNSHTHGTSNSSTGADSPNHTHSGIVRGVQSSDGRSTSHTHTYSRNSGASSPGTNSRLSASQPILNPYGTTIFAIRVQ